MIGLRNTALKKISDAGYGLSPTPFNNFLHPNTDESYRQNI